MLLSFVWELSEINIDSEEGAVGLRLCKLSRPDLFFHIYNYRL